MSSRPHPGSERPLHGPVQRFDLDAEVGRLREEGAWHRGQRDSITLRKGEGMNVVLLVMKSGDKLEEHAAPGPFSLSVREGRIRLEAAEAVVEAGPEALLTCDAGVRHTVVALSDAVYLLTIAGVVSEPRPPSIQAQLRRTVQTNFR
jgi:quercetin dioxygenase-like cupin family protein